MTETEVIAFLRERRIALGMTQEDLALESGTSKVSIGNRETFKKTGIKLPTLLSILDALNLEIQFVEKGV